MKNKISIFVIFLIVLMELYLGFIYYPKYKNSGTEASISWDVSGYYMYLPAIFIYKDLKHASYQDSVLNNYEPIPSFDHAAFKHESGNYIMKYSSGQAIVFSPAFFLAHFITKYFTAYPADGFSYPYQLAISIWTFLISIIGIYFLRKVLLKYFEDYVVALTLFSIVLCSNYLEYAAISGGLTHNSLFTVYVFILFFTIRFYKNQTFLNAAGIGFFCGLATLIRPTEMLSLSIPVFWGISSFEEFKNRINEFISSYLKLSIAIILFLFIGSIQLIYWKYVSGHFLVYSYQSQGFDWFKPHILDCLIDARAGWLLYSPIFIFTIVGVYFLYKNHRNLFFGILIFIIPFTYLCFAWSEWWYGWSLGQRAMIQSYPVWAFALAAFYQNLLGSKFYYRFSFLIVLSILMLYNFWLVKNCHKGGLLRGPEMTMPFLIEILGKSSIEKDKMVLLDNKDYYRDKINKTDTIYYNNLNNELNSDVIIEDTLSKNKKLVLNKVYQSSPIYTLQMSTSNRSKWYKISAEITCITKEYAVWDMPQFIVKFKKKDKTIKQNIIRINRLIEMGECKRLIVFSKPHRNDYDKVTIEFNNMNNNRHIEIDDILIERIIE